MKSKLDFIAATVANGLVESGEVRVGTQSRGGGGEARLLEMGTGMLAMRSSFGS